MQQSSPDFNCVIASIPSVLVALDVALVLLLSHKTDSQLSADSEP